MRVVIRIVEPALEQEAAGDEPVVSNVIVGRFAHRQEPSFVTNTGTVAQ